MDVLKTIESAPKDRDILVWFDHEADPYQDPHNPDRLTDYAVWAESGEFLDGKGFCIAKWHTAIWESEDEYGNGYWLPSWWFAKENDDYERVVNPTNWTDLPVPPVST